MTDTLLLKSMLVRRGVTLEETSEKIGISSTSLSYKINNKREFTAREILALSKLLNLTIEEKESIFFANSVDCKSH